MQQEREPRSCVWKTPIMKTDIPEFYLEQYRIGEASPEVAQLIESDPSALTRVAHLNAESAELLRTYSPEWFAERVVERAND